MEVPGHSVQYKGVELILHCTSFKVGQPAISQKNIGEINLPMFDINELLNLKRNSNEINIYPGYSEFLLP